MRKIYPILLWLLVSTQVFALGVGSGGNFIDGKGASTFHLHDGGTPILGVRNDGNSVLTGPLDLSYGPLSIDSTGRLNVNATPGQEAAIGAAGSTTTGATVFKLIAGRGRDSVVRVITLNPSDAVFVDGSNTTQPVSAASLPLPAGAATAANQTTGIIDLGLIVTSTAASAVGVTTINTTLGTVTANQTALNTSVFLLTARTPALGATTAANSTPVVFPTDIGTLAVNQPGRAVAFSNRISYATSTVTTTGFTMVIGSTPFASAVCDIFDSSGQTLLLATDSTSTIGNSIRIVPGGNGVIPILISSGVPVSIKAISGSASAGEFDMNCYK